MIAVAVVGCEVGFWVLLGAGLVARYGLRWERTSVMLLACVPLVDLALLALTVVDLRAGGTAGVAHGLAAVYLAFSVVFGHRTIRAVDQRVAHRFTGGPAPRPAPVRGVAGVREAWSSWTRALAAWAVAVVLLLAAVALVGDASRSAHLVDWMWWLTGGVAVWFVVGPLSAHVVGRRFA